MTAYIDSLVESLQQRNGLVEDHREQEKALESIDGAIERQDKQIADKAEPVLSQFNFRLIKVRNQNYHIRGVSSSLNPLEGFHVVYLGDSDMDETKLWQVDNKDFDIFTKQHLNPNYDRVPHLLTTLIGGWAAALAGAGMAYLMTPDIGEIGFAGLFVGSLGAIFGSRYSTKINNSYRKKLNEKFEPIKQGTDALQYLIDIYRNIYRK
jgi:hypothetical protein